MSTLIACSGSCHSGKTTLIKKLLEAFPGSVSLDELIRQKAIPNLTALRADPNAYLDVEWDIITQKMKQEADALTDGQDRLVIADRSLADSLYYLTRYTRVNDLTPDNVVRFYKLVSLITSQWDSRYSRIVFLKPIPILFDHDDPFRVGELNIIQQSEATSILAMVSWLAPTGQFDARTDTPQIIDWISSCLTPTSVSSGPSILLPSSSRDTAEPKKS